MKIRVSVFPFIAILVACDRNTGSTDQAPQGPAKTSGIQAENLEVRQDQEEILAPAEPEQILPNVDPIAENLEAKAFDVFAKYCASCHSASRIEGNFGSLDNPKALLETNRYVVPGEPEKSLVYTKLALRGNMPPGGSLKNEDITTVKDWIQKLKVSPLIPLKENELLNLIKKDLDSSTLAPSQKRNIRYFSLQVPNNIGISAESLNIQRKAFFKVIHSLSLAPQINPIQPIDKNQLVYRLIINEMGINLNTFDQLMMDFYPYGRQYRSVGFNNETNDNQRLDAAIRETIGTQLYLFRADWFTATAVLPPLYERFLNQGKTAGDLEVLLGLDLEANRSKLQIMRSGFKNSGVSAQNRVIERHLQNNGLPFWLSYDFANLEQIENIFLNPLGPSGFNSTKAFKHDGGEIIYVLPNSLFAYRLVTSAGAIIDRGPLNIVQQADAPPQFLSSIVNGVSCMNCHGSGLLIKNDEVSNFVKGNSGRFSSEELSLVASIYPEAKIFKDRLDQDNQPYFTALRKMGIDPKLPDPVNFAYRFFNRNLGAGDIMAELGISQVQLDRLLNEEPFRSSWISLKNLGYISRQEFHSGLYQALANSRSDLIVLRPRAGDYLVHAGCMAAGSLVMSACLNQTLAPPPSPSPSPTPSPSALLPN